MDFHFWLLPRECLHSLVTLHPIWHIFVPCNGILCWESNPTRQYIIMQPIPRRGSPHGGPNTSPNETSPSHGFHLEGHVTFPTLEMSMSSLMFLEKAHSLAHLLTSLLTIPFGVSYSSNCESSFIICFCVLGTRGILSFGSTSSHLSFSPCDLLCVGVHLKSNLATLAKQRLQMRQQITHKHKTTWQWKKWFSS